MVQTKFQFSLLLFIYFMVAFWRFRNFTTAKHSFLSFLLCSHPKIFLKHQSYHSPPLTKTFQGLLGEGRKSHLLLVLQQRACARPAWPVSPPAAYRLPPHLTPLPVHHQSPSSDRTTSRTAPGPRGLVQ